MTEQVQFILKARRILARIAKNKRHPRRVAFCAAWRTWAHDRPYTELSAALDRVGAMLDTLPDASADILIAMATLPPFTVELSPETKAAYAKYREHMERHHATHPDWWRHNVAAIDAEHAAPENSAPRRRKRAALGG